MISADLRKRRPKPHPTWHLDEAYLKIDGRMVYLWRAVDAEARSSMCWSSPSETTMPRCRAESDAQAIQEVRLRS
jgi:transposase-like protein